MAAYKSRRASNKKYLQELFKTFKDAPKLVALEAATNLFLKVVFDTPEDSGQAAANWRIEPYVGRPNLDNFEMMWGYGPDKPQEPVGYKWSKGASKEAVLFFQYEVAIQSRVAFERLKMDGIVVYNPMSESIPGFSPGDSEFYEANSIAQVQIEDAVSDALTAAYEWGAANIPALRIR